MSFFSRSDRYIMLCAIKRGRFAGRDLTDKERELTFEEEQFIREYAHSKVLELMEDPECAAALDRIYENKWAHRFD